MTKSSTSVSLPYQKNTSRSRLRLPTVSPMYPIFACGRATVGKKFRLCQSQPQGQKRIIVNHESDASLTAILQAQVKLSVLATSSLLLVLLLGVVTTTSGRLSPLPLNTTGSATTVRRGESVVDVLLGVESDNERRNVDDLLANSDVPLPDENTSVVNGLGETKLEYLGLQTPLEEVLSLEGQDVIETHASVVEHTNSNKTTDQSVTLEESLGVLVVELEELSGSTSDLGEGELDTPDLSLVTETVLARKLELGVETGSLVGPLRDLVGLGLLPGRAGHFSWWMKRVSKLCKVEC